MSEKTYDHYLITFAETYSDLEFSSKSAIRITTELSRKEQKEEIEQFISGWRDSAEEVEKIGEGEWTGPSGVVIRLRAFKEISEGTWKFIHEEGLMHNIQLDALEAEHG